MIMFFFLRENAKEGFVNILKWFCEFIIWRWKGLFLWINYEDENGNIEKNSLNKSW